MRMSTFRVSSDLQYAACDESLRADARGRECYSQYNAQRRVVRWSCGTTRFRPGRSLSGHSPTFYPRAQFFKTNKGPQSARLILERSRHSLGLRIISQNSSTSVFSEAVIFSRPRRLGARARFPYYFL